MRGGRSGSSLLELLAATAMISMVCGLGMMRLGESLAGNELSAAALELAADLRWMQQASVNSPAGAGGPFYLLVFENSGGSGYRITASAKSVKKVVFPASVRLAGGAANLSFSSSGSPTNAQSVALRSLRLQKSRYVIIAAVTGRVRISDSPAWEAGE